MRRLLGSFMVLMGVMFVGAQAIVGVAQLHPRAGFLGAYEVLMPGQPIERIADFPCQMHTGISDNVEVGLCQFEANGNVFGRVTVIEKARIIQQLSLEILPNTLHLGDLIACWGAPSQMASIPAVVEGRLPITRWGNQVFVGHSMIQSGTPSRYFVAVNYLSLENAPLPCVLSE